MRVSNLQVLLLPPRHPDIVVLRPFITFSPRIQMGWGSNLEPERIELLE